MNLEQALQYALSQLNQSGVDSSATDATALVCYATNCERLDLIIKNTQELSEDQQTTLEDIIQRRCQHEPLSHILGKGHFWGYEFYVSADVLTPRPDSEVLIATLGALFPYKNAQGRIVDVGTGSGCLLISALKEYSHMQGEGVDISEAALAIAHENSQKHELQQRLTLHHGSLLEPVAGDIDILISNPPYIETEEIETLDVEVKNHEPMLALDGGEDGLNIYRSLLQQACDKVKSGGLILLEIGHKQAQDVCSLFEENMWHTPQVYQDLANRDRVIASIRK